ncbi:TOPBP1 [Auxenochlorella protothecoides x Auxenochlorella symbiontica]
MSPSRGLFAGHRVLCTAVTVAERDRLVQHLREEGATLITVFSVESPPDVVVTRSALATGSRLCRLSRPDIPAVTPDWVTACVSAGRLLAHHPHRLPCFSGMTICLSGLGSSEKQDLVQLVEAHNGRHSAALDRRCTHLVTCTTQSDKYRFALTHDIVCVSPAWVQSSVSHGFCPPELDFPCSDENADPNPSASMLEQTRDGSGAAAPRSGSSLLPTCVLQPSSRPPALSDPSAGPMSLCMDACYLWLVGCGPQEQLQALQAIRRVAAKRFAVPHPLLTHVIVGGALGDTDARRVAAVASGNASLQVVCLDWLLDCVKKGCILACRPYHFRAPPGARGGAGAIAMAGMSSGTAEQSASEASKGHAGILVGRYFTLSALCNPEELARARQVIKSQGGKIFHESTVHTVPSREVAYALCPASLTHAQVKALCSASSDFTYVPEDHRVTSYWMECSLLAGKLVPHSRGAPCYRPLPYPFPLPGVEKLRICISGYDVHVRSAINFSVQLVGGTHSSEAMTRANTHLVLPEAVGEKYKHCAAFGVTPVTADWLVDSITAGLLQPEKEYHPGRRAAAQPPLAHQSQAGGRPRQGQSQEQCGAGEGRASQASRKRAGEGAPADLGPLNLESLLEMTEGGAGHREKAGPPPKRCWSRAGDCGAASQPLQPISSTAPGGTPGPAPGLDDVVDTISCILEDLSNSLPGDGPSQHPRSQGRSTRRAVPAGMSGGQGGRGSAAPSMQDCMVSQSIEYGC